jgi:putative NADH-flavin reductase
MRIAIFGASGRTGQHLVRQALDAGHHVVAFVRSPAKLGIHHERLSVVPGDVQDVAQVEKAVTGADAVISALGPTSNTPEYKVSQGIENILAAMEKQGIRRLVISAGAGVGDANDKPRLFNKAMNVLLNVVARHVYEDMRRSVEIVRASDLDWTIVRVPMLTDGPATGNIQVGYVGKGMGPRLSRADMATFMLQQATSDSYLRQAPAISH